MFLSIALLAAAPLRAVLLLGENPPRAESSRCARVEPDLLVTPGIGMGRLKLGMTREEAERVLGAPFVSTPAAGPAGGVSLLYRSADGRNYLGLNFEAGRLEHIEFTSPRFSTADCRSTANPVDKDTWVEVPGRGGSLTSTPFGKVRQPWDGTVLTFGHVHLGLPPHDPEVIADVLAAFPPSEGVAAPNWKAAEKIDEKGRVFYLVPVQTTLAWGPFHPEPLPGNTVRYELYDRRDGKPLRTFGEEYPEHSEPVRVKDVNKDGYPDLIDGYTPGACGSSYTEDIYTYDPEAGTFKLALSGGAAKYDDEKGEITFTECESCSCQRYTTTVYRLNGSTFVMVGLRTETME